MKFNKKLISVLLFLFVSIVMIKSADVEVFAYVGKSTSSNFKNVNFSNSNSGSLTDFYIGKVVSVSKSSYSSGYGNNHYNNDGNIMVLIIIIVAILFFVPTLISKYLWTIWPDKKSENKGNLKGNKSAEYDVQLITKVDENFSKDKFIDYVNEVYITIQEAWEAREWNSIRPFESNELFERHNEQLNEYVEKNLYPHLDKQEILLTKIVDYYADGCFEYITVKLAANLIDYTTDASGKVVEGSKTDNKYRIYKLNFKRIKGVKSSEVVTNVVNCPSCSAPKSINAGGKCEYCGSTITTGNYNWVLDEYSKWID